jgi:hypothetical protein
MWYEIFVNAMGVFLIFVLHRVISNSPILKNCRTLEGLVQKGRGRCGAALYTIRNQGETGIFPVLVNLRFVDIYVVSSKRWMRFAVGENDSRD